MSRWHWEHLEPRLNLFSASAESLPPLGRSAVVALGLNEGECADWVLQVQPTADCDSAGRWAKSKSSVSLAVACSRWVCSKEPRSISIRSERPIGMEALTIRHAGASAVGCRVLHGVQPGELRWDTDRHAAGSLEGCCAPGHDDRCIHLRPRRAASRGMQLSVSVSMGAKVHQAIQMTVYITLAQA